MDIIPQWYLMLSDLWAIYIVFTFESKRELVPYWKSTTIK